MRRPTAATCVLACIAQKSNGLANPKEANLQGFIDESGGRRSCQIGTSKHGVRGLLATSDLRPGEAVLQIPLSCVLVEQDDGMESWPGRLANQLINRSKDCCYKASLPEPPCTPARGDWPASILDAFENPSFIDEINEAHEWRMSQYEQHCGVQAKEQEFLNTLDLVCSRTIRIKNELMLVPLLDMANHASRNQGGGYFKKLESSVCLMAGDRGVRNGEEVTLDYGDRRNEEWLIHYGFLPDRNAAETITLPQSKPVVSWDDVGTLNVELRQQCLEYLNESKSSLEEDLGLLHSPIDDFRMVTAIKYRVDRKILLSAIAGEKAANRLSAFSSFA